MKLIIGLLTVFSLSHGLLSLNFQRAKRNAISIREGSPDSECEFTNHESRWRESCNWCRCSPAKRGICTRRGCPPALDINLRESKECEGDPIWKVKCNWCNCIDGRSVCTENICDILPKTEEHLSKSDAFQSELEDSGKECVATDAEDGWKHKCNWCRCINGISQCTRKGCFQELEKDASDSPICRGNAKWKADCNWCHCVEGKGNCTNHICELSDSPAPTSREASCEVGPTGGRWLSQCNWCSCHNGINVCTKRACAPGNEAVVRDDPACEGTIKWKVDCNWCSCNEGQANCTKYNCADGGARNIQETITMCKEGTQWIQGCNTCHCAGGISICTQKACVEVMETKINQSFLAKEASKFLTVAASFYNNDVTRECKDGSRWKCDCNWCTCLNGVAGCTEKGCLPGADENINERKCDAGSEWKKDCNTCSCSSDGVPICTAMNCTIPGTNKNENTLKTQQVTLMKSNLRNGVDETQPSVPVGAVQNNQPKCKDGSRWRWRCNWCTCQNGAAVCSLRACVPGTRDEHAGSCEGESQWMQDCNFCSCINGRSICSQKACFAIRPSSQPALDENRCTPGNNWKEDCNLCVCINHIAVCTKRSCVIPQPRFEKCIEGMQWQKDCNTCSCTNGNVICTEKQCTSSNLDVCNSPPVKPNGLKCFGFEIQWTYNATSRKCEEMVYTGCGGTENLFDTKEMCQSKCEVVPSNPSVATDKWKEWCALPVKPGICFAYLERYAFVPEKNRCEQFIYTGCHGNANNFRTAHECHENCGGTLPPKEDEEEESSK